MGGHLWGARNILLVFSHSYSFQVHKFGREAPRAGASPAALEKPSGCTEKQTRGAREKERERVAWRGTLGLLWPRGRNICSCLQLACHEARVLSILSIRLGLRRGGYGTSPAVPVMARHAPGLMFFLWGRYLARPNARLLAAVPFREILRQRKTTRPGKVLYRWKTFVSTVHAFAAWFSRWWNKRRPPDPRLTR